MHASLNNSGTDKQQYRLDSFNAGDSWRLFRIMSEFVDGFDALAEIKQPAVSIFGSARTSPDDKYYKVAEEIASRLAAAGYAVITGGGPGIMEAANKGASSVANGISVGLNISLPFEQAPNEFANLPLSFKYFFVRKVMFIKYAMAFIGMPGGFGTMDELFEALTLIQTRRIKGFPIILVGRDYWGGLIDWIKDVLLKSNHVNSDDMLIFDVMEDPDEIVHSIKRRVIV